jgi:hypothetical protein
MSCNMSLWCDIQLYKWPRSSIDIFLVESDDNEEEEKQLNILLKKITLSQKSFIFLKCEVIMIIVVFQYSIYEVI